MASAYVNVAAGFYSDVSKLLEQFADADEVRMNKFTKIWREMKFMKVFMYREDVEIILFLEECFRILLRIILGEQSLQYRIGAFFCLYSMYTMQPLDPKIKIRLVPEAWRRIQNMIGESQLEPWENDIKYAFWSLTYQNAFFFVAKPNATGLVSVSTEGDMLSNRDFSGVMEQYMNSDHQNLKELHDRYLRLKETLNSPTHAQLLDKQLFSTIEADVAALQGKYHAKNAQGPSEHKRTGMPSDMETSENSSENEGSEDDTLERRRKVRKKHHAHQAKQSKSRRHRETAGEVEQGTSKKGKGGPQIRERGTFPRREKKGERQSESRSLADLQELGFMSSNAEEQNKD